MRLVTVFHMNYLLGPRNSQKWFDDEVLEKLNLRNELFKKIKKSRLHIDKELHEE